MRSRSPTGIASLFVSWPVVLVLAALPSLARAQAAGGYSAEPSKEAPDYSTTVSADRPSPEQTQDRLFTGTRFWRLDPGRYEVEVWWQHDFNRDHTHAALLQMEIEIGLAPRLQLDLYQNFNWDPTNGLTVEGQQIELRISAARAYNEIALNPVLYLEFHPRHGEPDRAEVRLLLGGNLGATGLWAANAYAESNIDDFSTPNGPGVDAEVGLTAAASLEVVADCLRIGAEMKTGGDQHGMPTFSPVLMLGPNLLLRVPQARLKLTVTAFYGFMSNDPRFRILAIAGWGF